MDDQHEVELAVINVDEPYQVERKPFGSNRLPVIAAEVKIHVANGKRSSAEAMSSFIQAGTLLNEAKDIIGHGLWGTWVNENCSVSHQMACDYMTVVRRSIAVF
jgi:hypothetical protein